MQSSSAPSSQTIPGPGFARGRLAPWFGLLLGLAAIGAFMFLLIPALDHVPGYEEIIRQNQELEIRATALFYSDLEETNEAQNYLRNSRRFAAGR